MFELSQVHFCDFHQSEILFRRYWQIFSRHTIPNSFKEIGTLLSTIFFSFLQVTFSLGKLKCCCMFFL